MKIISVQYFRIILATLLLVCFMNSFLNASNSTGYLVKSTTPKSLLLKDKADSFLENGTRYYSYSPGIYAPFGIMLGIQSKVFGIYCSGRINKNVFKKAGQYYFEGTRISDHSLNWKYNDEKMYSRYEANVGLMGKVYEKKDRFSFILYSGIGVLKPRYMYSFTQVGLNSISKQQWVLYKEISKLSINTEAGFIFLIKQSISFNFGLSGITRKHERMITFGIGISKPRSVK